MTAIYVIEVMKSITISLGWVRSHMCAY